MNEKLVFFRIELFTKSEIVCSCTSENLVESAIFNNNNNNNNFICTD